MLQIIRYDIQPSTNTELNRLADLGGASHGTVIWCRSQSAGRGQRGNSWESAPGMNVTMSVLLEPHGMEPRSQFHLSEAVALAVAETLDRHLPGPMRASVKWPNDIYVGDRKICGILIEHRVSPGRIERTVAGIGLNVNQTEFLSDAPNPVSMAQLTGRTFDVEALVEEIAGRVVALAGRAEDCHTPYLSRLWRREEWHLWAEPGSDTFEARIHSVAPSGMLTLERRDGTLKAYAFKEVAAVI